MMLANKSDVLDTQVPSLQQCLKAWITSKSDR